MFLLIISLESLFRTVNHKSKPSDFKHEQEHHFFNIIAVINNNETCFDG